MTDCRGSVRNTANDPHRARQTGQPQLENGGDAGLLNRVDSHRQCHCKDSIREEGSPDLWDSACTLTRTRGME
jgi:hypothetical protein